MECRCARMVPLTGCHSKSLFRFSAQYPKRRRQNTSVETDDFLQKNVKCRLVEFCRSVTRSPHVRVKGHLGGDSQLFVIGDAYML